MISPYIHISHSNPSTAAFGFGNLTTKSKVATRGRLKVHSSCPNTQLNAAQTGVIVHHHLLELTTSATDGPVTTVTQFSFSLELCMLLDGVTMFLMGSTFNLNRVLHYVMETEQLPSFGVPACEKVVTLLNLNFR
ncbi:hypothetical protein ABKN59_005099 [Abortiporus biennis]